MKWLKISVIGLIFCVFMCYSMTTSELEDFSNFLKRTSQLDQILKKGTTPDVNSDEDEIISDHAWEESGKFEGDLILNDRQRRVIVQDVAEGLSRNGLRDSTKRWPDNEVVFYIQREHFSGDQVQAIMDGIDDLSRASCVKFRPYRKGDRDAVVIQGSRRGCFSQVGYQGGYQVLNLSGRHPVGKGCFRHGTVVHELLHTLGFYHMQSSPDRDDYIDVKWENIVEPAKHNFRKYNTFSVSDFGVGYDYDSVLHYSRRAFSKNGQDTLVPKQSGASIGQRIGISDKDAQKLNKMYCDADSDNADASEEATHKPIIIKKTPKNKPFEGHGIGYHQGKTVVIKLPAAETINLQDPPAFHVFDHFSKTPQTVSPAVPQGFGTGEEIRYDYKPPPFDPKDFEKSSFSNTNDKNNNRVPKYDFNIHKNVFESSTPAVAVTYDEKTSEKIGPVQDVLSSSAPGKPRDDINEAFDRLGEIIKSHVYPSHPPELDIYKKRDYSEYYTPKQYHEPEPEIVKVDKKFSSTVTLQPPIVSQHQMNEQKQPETEKTKYDDVEIFGSPYTDERLHKEYDASYGTSYPLNLLPRVNAKPFVTPEYARLENLANKHNYSGLYRPIGNDEPRNEKQHTLLGSFGYIVPIHGPFYNNDDFKKDNLKYDQGSYSNSYGYEHRPAKFVKAEPQYTDDSIFGHSPGKQAYSLFGVLVPLTQKWYKLDYEPHKGPYTIEKPESSEDYR